MSDPLNQHTGKEQRRSDQEKVLAVLDTLRAIVEALFRIFGRRRGDPS